MNIERKEYERYTEMRGRKGHKGISELFGLFGRGFYGGGFFDEECINFGITKKIVMMEKENMEVQDFKFYDEFDDDFNEKAD